MFLKSKNGKGFTLGELLVVMSIIIVLSSIILIGRGDSEKRALNTKRIELINQYIAALDMYRQEHNNLYPYIGTASACLGDEPNDVCAGGSGGTVSESSALNAELVPYIPGLPPLPDLEFTNLDPFYTGLPYWNGGVYRCSNYTGSNCYQYELRWYMYGKNQSCGPGNSLSWTYSDDTPCRYTSMKFR